MLAILLFTMAADPLPAPRFASLPTPKFADCDCAVCRCAPCDGRCGTAVTESGGEWVVKLNGRTFTVSKSESRETAVRLAKEVAGSDGPTATARVAAATPARVAVAVPPGSHAHTKADGTTVIHGNGNVGNAAAHAGIPRPWIRTAEAGQAVPAPAFIPLQSYFPAASSCPDGKCPNVAPATRTRR